MTTTTTKKMICGIQIWIKNITIDDWLIITEPVVIYIATDFLEENKSQQNKIINK